MKVLNLQLSGIIFLVNVFALFFSHQGSAQSNLNYYSLISSWDSLYVTNPGLKQEEDGGYTQYIRWKEFWKNRVYCDDVAKSGSFKIALEARDRFIKKKKSSGIDLFAPNWRTLGPKNLSTQNLGLVSAVYVDTVIDKTMRTIYIGTNSSGVWKTTDGGVSWNNITDDAGFILNGITDIVGDLSRPDVIYFSTGGNIMGRDFSYGTGIYRTNDGGQSWENIFPVEPRQCLSTYRLLIDPTNSQRIYALIGTSLYRTDDGGSGGIQSWKKLFTVPRDATYNNAEYRYLRDIEMKPNDHSILYIASDYCFYSNRNNAGVWKVTNANSLDSNLIQISRIDSILPNNGNTLHTQRFEIAVTAAHPDLLYVSCNDLINNRIDSTRLKLWSFENNNWVKKIDLFFPFNSTDNCSGIGYFKFELLISPVNPNKIYFGGNTFDRFENWNHVCHTQYETSSLNYHPDTRDAKIFRAGNNDIIFAGNDGGISKSSDGINSWTSLNGEGLVITQIWGIGLADSIKEITACGIMDNGFEKLKNEDWTHSGGCGDLGDVQLDYHSPAIIYGPSFGTGTTYTMKSRDEGDHWSTTIDSTVHEKSILNKPIIIHPAKKDTIFEAFHSIYKSNDQLKNSFYMLVDPAPVQDNCKKPVSAMYIPPHNLNMIYIAYEGPIYSWECQNQKFLKYISGNLTDLTSNINSIHIGSFTVLQCYGITGISGNPKNENELWVSLGGFNQSGQYRVLHSQDGGEQWQDWSDNLPEFPINCIKYGKETLDGVLVGTDVGIFFRGRTDSIWQSLNQGLPSSIITDIEFNEAGTKMKIATFGRGVWEADLSCNFDNEPLVITTDQTWTNDVTMDRSILLSDSSTLTIKSTVKFPPMARIMIRPGSKLIVDGGTLTNACFSMWQGVQVWGHANMVQGLPLQGCAIFKNRAILENARIGVAACRTDENGEIDWRSTGGIIIGDSSIFRNNFEAVKFVSYSRVNSSRFNNMIFETTREFIDGVSNPRDFVSLFDVRGVMFKGCTFRNTKNETPTIPNPRSGNGIYSINASYQVDQFEYCKGSISPCPKPLRNPSTFSGLRYGILAVNADPSFWINVKRTRFEGNYRGIYLGAVDFATITQDTLMVPGLVLALDTCYGLYLDHCTAYKVQENRFVSTFLGGGRVPNSLGIIVNNSGADPNEIYNNCFTDIAYGINSQDINRSSSGMTGLVLKCNDFINTKYDNLVSISNPNHVNDWGIALYQGDSLTQTGPAGNTFSLQHTNTQIPTDINNTGARFKYYHHIQPLNAPYKVRPDCYFNVTVRPTVWNFDSTRCCPSKLIGSGINTTDLKDEITKESDTIINKELQLNALIDGGNSETLNSEILSSTPPESLELRDQLINKSPYLSDTAMQSAISKEDVLPNEIIRDVLVANPQSATSDKVLAEMNNRYIPMPDSMMAEILAGEDIVSAKEAMESGLASHKAKRAQALFDLINFYQNDTINPSSHDSLIALLQNQPDLPLKYRLAFEYLSTGDTSSLNNTLVAIPLSLNLDQQEIDVHNDYLTYFSVMKNLERNNRNILTMDSASLALIQNLYANDHEPVRSIVRNILIARGELNYHEPILLPDDLKSSKEKKRYLTSKFTDKSYLKVFPNPAKQYVIVEYNLKEKFSNKHEVLLILTNIKGSPVLVKKLIKRQDQELINTSGFISGTYICSLMVNGKTLDNKKLVVLE